MGWVGPLTHRQFLSWTCWLKEQWNKPDRTDHYLMQLAAVSAAAGGAKDQTTDKYRLEFNFTQDKQRLAEPAPIPGLWTPKRLTKQDIENIHKKLRMYQTNKSYELLKKQQGGDNGKRN